jgi:thiamine-monophosphate kinase
MIDVSDGLLGDLAHICGASGVGARIEAESIPLAAEISILISDAEAALELALNGGEDFELLLTAAPDKDMTAIAHDLTAIGIITSNENVLEITQAGTTRKLTPESFRHF